MDFDKEIIERLTRIEAGQADIMRRLDGLTKTTEQLNVVIFDHEKRLASVEYGLKDHIQDEQDNRRTVAWRYGLIIPLLVSGAVALVDILMRFAGY